MTIAHDTTHRETVIVVGAGTMGRGIATVAVLAGFPTVVVDIDDTALQAARAAIERRVRRVAGETGDDTGLAALDQLRTDTDLSAAVATAGAVVEAVPEVEQLKVAVFSQITKAAPAGALLATNTSTMSVSAIADACGGSPRVIGMHFFNPVHRMALVEVVVGARSSEQTVSDAVAFAGALGKQPVVVRDVPGFVTSRLGLLLGNEAMRLVEEGVASAVDVDTAMRLGYGHPMGPLELADLVGLDARLNNLRSMHERSGLDHYRAPAILERLVAAGRWGRKTGSGFYDYDESGRAIGPAGDLA